MVGSGQRILSPSSGRGVRALRTIYAVIALLALATPASAGFVPNRAAWLALTPEQRSGYAIGLYDALLMFSLQDKSDEAIVRGTQKCFVEQKIGSGDIETMLDKGYGDVANWSHPPLYIFIDARKKLCLRYINEERRAFGLPPWTP